MADSRFVVTELEGFASVIRSTSSPGLSCMVIDTKCNRRVMATWRSEDFRGALARTWARERAAREAERLNRAAL